MYGWSQKQQWQAFLSLFLHSPQTTALERCRAPDLQSQVWTGLPGGKMTLDVPASEPASIAGGALFGNTEFQPLQGAWAILGSHLKASISILGLQVLGRGFRGG